MPVHLLPVIGDPRAIGPGYATPDVRPCTHGRIRKSRVVGEEADITAALFGAPADVAVATAQMTRSR
jgi:hypothetical protein